MEEEESKISPPEAEKGNQAENVISSVPSAGAPSSSLRYRGKQDKAVENTETTAAVLKENGLETYFPDPDIDEPPLLEVVAWWSEFTSIHGVYYMFERGHFEQWKLNIWSVFVVACFFSLVVTLVSMIQEFKQFNVNTSQQPITPSALAFPQVTVCNSNNFATSLQNATNITEPQTEEELRAISQPLEEMILETSFNTIGLKPGNFSRFWTPTITHLGLCYSFNTDAKVLKPGPGAGLQITAWLNQSNYQAYTLQAGLFVFVTERGTDLISDQTSQVLVSAGASTFLSIESSFFERERQSPWSNCSGDAPEYTTDKCRAECSYAHVRQACGCRLIGDPNTTDNLTYCTSEDIPTNVSAEAGDLISGYELDEAVQSGDLSSGKIPSSWLPCDYLAFNSVLESCECNTPPCSEEDYVVSASDATLAKRFVRNVETSFPELLQDEDDDIESNLVHVVINFNSIKYHKFTESKAQSLSGLVSDLGGQMGFFMGISVISVVELIVELFGLRILPRFLRNDNRLYGVGQRRDRTRLGVVT